MNYNSKCNFHLWWFFPNLLQLWFSEEDPGTWKQKHQICAADRGAHLFRDSSSCLPWICYWMNLKSTLAESGFLIGDARPHGRVGEGGWGGRGWERRAWNLILRQFIFKKKTEKIIKSRVRLLSHPLMLKVVRLPLLDPLPSIIW